MGNDRMEVMGWVGGREAELRSDGATHEVPRVQVTGDSGRQASEGQLGGRRAGMWLLRPEEAGLRRSGWVDGVYLRAYDLVAGYLLEMGTVGG